MTFRRFLPQVQIILMVIFGRVEGEGLSDLRGGTIAHLHEFAEYAEGGVSLFGIVAPNGGKILCANINALTIGLLEVVDFEEIAH